MVYDIHFCLRRVDTADQASSLVFWGAGDPGVAGFCQASLAVCGERFAPQKGFLRPGTIFRILATPANGVKCKFCRGRALPVSFLLLVLDRTVFSDS